MNNYFEYVGTKTILSIVVIARYIVIITSTNKRKILYTIIYKYYTRFRRLKRIINVTLNTFTVTFNGNKLLFRNIKINIQWINDATLTNTIRIGCS